MVLQTSASSRQQGQEVARLRAEVTLLKDCLVSSPVTHSDAESQD